MVVELEWVGWLVWSILVSMAVPHICLQDGFKMFKLAHKALSPHICTATPQIHYHPNPMMPWIRAPNPSAPLSQVYKQKVVDIFQRIAKDVAGDVPLKVINDGEARRGSPRPRRRSGHAIHCHDDSSECADVVNEAIFPIISLHLDPPNLHNSVLNHLT